MAATIINAAPMMIEYGTQDLSTKQLPRTPEAIPQHLPKFFIFAKTGPLEPQLVSGAELVNMYGSETFDLRGKYANYSTAFLNAVNAEGNACMVERVIADDAGPEANVALWLDVLETDVDLYARNVDGSIKYDNSGAPVITGTTPGFKVKWVVSTHSTTKDLQDKFGQLSIQPGNQTDSKGNTSQRYPIREFKASFLGAAGANAGFRIWAPTVATETMPTTMMSKTRTYPFRYAVVTRRNASSSAAVTDTIFGDKNVMFVDKPGTIDPTTDAQLYSGDVLLQGYQNLTDLKYPAVHGSFGQMAIYQNNIDTLVAKFHAAEVPFIDQFSDFTEADDDMYLFNYVSGVSSQNVPYHSFQFKDDVDSIRLTQYTNVFAQSGSDGSMDNDTYNQLVSARVLRYLDKNDPLQEVAYNVESIIYDTGFQLQTKYDIAAFISQRRDTVVALGTHDAGSDYVMSASEEHSVAVALRTRLQMYPESDYFGTPCMRAVIMGRSGKVRNSQYTGRLPLTYELAVKSARYMGSGDGKWKGGKNFDGAPGSVLDYMYDISITWVPTSVRNRNWDVGLNWVQQYDRRSYFFPAIKTVYPDDTSVLNSYFTIMAIAQINKVCHACWREFSGVANLTNAQLVERVNAFVSAKTQGRFDGRFIIEPNAVITDMDALRGFSWTLPVKVYSPNMKTVCTSYVQAYRLDDYAGK